VYVENSTRRVSTNTTTRRASETSTVGGVQDPPNPFHASFGVSPPLLVGRDGEHAAADL